MGKKAPRAQPVANSRKGERVVSPRPLPTHVCVSLSLTIKSANLVLRWVAADKATRIPISMFHTALKISGNDVSVEEAECLVANQIYKNFIRGYISHEKQMVVLASVNTFPRLADRPTPFALI